MAVFVVGLILFFGIVNGMVRLSQKLPMYRLVTDGHDYYVQSRVFLFYCTELQTTNKMFAYEFYQDTVDRANVFRHPAAWTVIEVSTNK